MAQRRMFSPDIVESEEFLDMPDSSQVLYFHLGMRADDDGFIQPKLVMRLTGANNDDLKVLLAKRFLLPFESGVVVVKHWLIHNMIRSDRYKPTRFLKEKESLFLKKNKVYTDDPTQGKPLLETTWQPNGNQMEPQVRLGKVRKGKDSIDNITTTPAVVSQSETEPVNEFIGCFKNINPSFELLYKNRTQRASASRLLKKFGIEAMTKTVSVIEKTNTMPYAPVITTPLELEKLGGKLKAFLAKNQQENLKNQIVSV